MVTLAASNSSVVAAAVAAGRGKASAAVATDEPEMPEHDLEPPKFSRQALQTLLSNWRALKAMILTGSKHSTQKKNAGNSQMCEEQAFLTSQSGTALLDKFTHCLLVKCSGEMLDVLLDTIIRQVCSLILFCFLFVKNLLPLVGETRFSSVPPSNSLVSVSDP